MCPLSFDRKALKIGYFIKSQWGKALNPQKTGVQKSTTKEGY